jgi:predicted metal-dependent phosphoesterase TrpH
MRVAPHVHSTWSYDGQWALEELSRAFAHRGYGAVLLAEHDRTFDAGRWETYRDACASASASGALLVPGIEYSDAENRVHVPVWGAEEFLGRARPTAGLLADVQAAGGVAILAHPARRDAWRALASEAIALADGVEVWNRKYDGWAPSGVALELARRYGLTPFVGLDFHTARQFFPLALAGPLEHPVSTGAVLTLLRAGGLTPTAFTRPADRFAHGPAREAARAGELARRTLARTVRQARAAARS